MSLSITQSTPKIKKQVKISVPFELVEAVNSPSYAEFRNKQRSNLILQKYSDFGRLTEPDETPKTNHPLLEYERASKPLKRIEAWLSPVHRKTKGSMFCSEFMTKNQILEVRRKGDILYDKNLSKRVAKESTKLSQQYVEDLDQLFLQKHPSHAAATQLMKKMIDSNGSQRIPNLDFFDDPLLGGLPRLKSNKSKSARLPTIKINSGSSSENANENTQDSLNPPELALNRFERAAQKKKTLENIYGRPQADQGMRSAKKKVTHTAQHLAALGLTNVSKKNQKDPACMKNPTSPKVKQIKVRNVSKVNEKAKVVGNAEKRRMNSLPSDGL